MSLAEKESFIAKVLTLHAYLHIVRHIVISVTKLQPAQTCESTWDGTCNVINRWIKPMMQGMVYPGILPVKTMIRDAFHFKIEDTYQENYVSNLVWTHVLSYEHQIQSLTTSPIYNLHYVDVMRIMNQLMAVDLRLLSMKTRLFYLYSLHEMIWNTPSLDYLKSAIDALIIQHDYEKMFENTLNIVDALHPITGRIGRMGGQSVLNSLITDYAAGPPTRSEMINRIISIIT